MTDFQLDKVAITNNILAILNPNFNSSDSQIALYRWWKNIRKDGGLLLTPLGTEQFDRANIKFYEFSTNEFLSNTMLLQMDRYLLCPYSIQYKKNNTVLRIYDSRIAALIGLHGNIINYINSLDIKRTELTENCKR